MERKSKVLVYLPRTLYIQLHERQLTNHVSYLVSRLLEEFLMAADVRISWAEMPSKTEQRQYLEQKLQEFLSGTIKGSPPQESSLEKAEENSLRETVSSLSEVNREEVKTEKEKKEEKKTEEEEPWDSEERRIAEFLKRFEQFW